MTKTKREQFLEVQTHSHPCEEGCTCYRHATMSRLCPLVNPETGRRCVKKLNCKGMCRNHYVTAEKYGDPFHVEIHGPDNSKRGGARNFNDSSECIEVMRSVGLNPIEEYANASVKWKCECMLCGEPTAVKYRHVKQGIYSGQKVVGGKGYGCKTCTNPRVLSEEEAIARALAKGLEPLEPYVDSHTSWKMRCLTCTQPTSPTLSSLLAQGGCLTCGASRRGWRYTEDPSSVYLMTNPQKKALKVGIAKTARVQRRMSEHPGFKPVKVWHFHTGQAAFELEQAVLMHWRRDLGNPPRGFLAKDEMGHSGHEETASTRKVGLANTIDYIDTLAPRRDTI